MGAVKNEVPFIPQERERIELRPRSQQGLMGHNGCSCQSLIDPIKELQQAGSNALLTRVPHEKTHGPTTIIKC